MKKPILCLDFDGVIHSYTSGWKGASVIPDPPVPVALQFIIDAMKYFEVHIFSSRSRQWGGKRAMKKWLLKWLLLQCATYETTPPWLQAEIHAFADPWREQVEFDMRRIVYREIKWPWFKPSAMVTLDDRAITFIGEFPVAARLLKFKPWNKK